MISFRHADVDYGFSLEAGGIVDLSLENPKLYRSFVKDLLNEDEDIKSLSEDGKELDFAKTALVITDLFDLDPNSKRILASIYKKIDKTSLSPERQAQFDEINRKIGELIGEIASDFEGQVTYNDVLSLPQVLGMIDFKFDYDDSTFLSSFVSYFKAWREAMNLKIIFVLNLFAMLKTEEITVLSSELAYSGLCLFNISYFHQSLPKENVKSVVVDKDLCIIEG